jgi:pimeloyl-ACP methyl ester carboxylesterase
MIAFYLALCVMAGVAGFIFLAPDKATNFALSLERKYAGLKLKRQAVAGFTMPYLEGGKGETLILIHGFGGDKDNFTRMAGRLTGRFRVIIPDLPGFGDATRDHSAQYRMSDQVARLQAFCRGLGLNRVSLGGNSMGGFIAAQYASEFPEEVAALWLIAPAGVEAAYDNALFLRYQQTGKMPLLIREPGEGRALLAAAMSRPPFIPGFVLDTLSRRGARDYTLHSQIMTDLGERSPLLETQFRSLATPTLIVWGDEDQILNPKAAEIFLRLFPNSKLVLMPGIGHVPMMEAPSQTARAFLDWHRHALSHAENWSRN